MKSYTTEILIIININIRLFNIAMKPSGVTYMTIIVMIIININIRFYNIITNFSGALNTSSSLSSFISSTSWNLFLQIWENLRQLYDSLYWSMIAFSFSHCWIFLLSALLDLNFSCSQHFCKKCTCFCCYQVNSVWIVKSHRLYACLFLFLWKIFLDYYYIQNFFQAANLWP